MSLLTEAPPRRRQTHPPMTQEDPAIPPASAPVPAGLTGLPLSEALDEFERGLISAALTQSKGNVAEAARVLQTDRANLYLRMRRLGIEKSTEGDA